MCRESPARAQMSDNPTPTEKSPEPPPSTPRLRRCRQYSHGLSRAPVAKNAVPLGEKAILPCPRDCEGTCPYRKPYGCNDVIRGIALELGGQCVVETAHYDALWSDLLRLLDYEDGDEPGAEVLHALELLCEAMIYARRAQSYELRRMVGEVPSPTRTNHLRFMTAGTNAWLRRVNELAIARMRELDLDVDRIIEESEGLAWGWWHRTRKDRWVRRFYVRPKERVPKTGTCQRK